VRERIVPVLVLSALLVGGLGALLPASPDPEDEALAAEDRFYLAKTHGPHRCDVIVLGDSRALRGIAPSEMEEVLPGRRIFNFAYNAGSLNPEMYREAEKRLDPRSDEPAAVLLAVTPLSLLGWKATNEQYAELRAVPPDEVWLKIHRPGLVRYFQPLTPSAFIAAALGPANAPRTLQTFHDDGWIESERTPPNPEEALAVYAKRLRGRSVDAGLVDALVERTVRWSERGIRVFAFRPPTTDAVVALEDRMTGFDEEALARRVEEAGGRWLRFGNDGYGTYDGSHLDRESARRFSRDLAPGSGTPAESGCRRRSASLSFRRSTPPVRGSGSPGPSRFPKEHPPCCDRPVSSSRPLSRRRLRPSPPATWRWRTSSGSTTWTTA
jgi:hypothetical protein